ncbi:MAG: hypothetical protein QOJ25_30, partial [Solirubrobacteraceae bacterium]|nr:hypothetical protein [Solirubrobacteraceae bacterium]
MAGMVTQPQLSPSAPEPIAPEPSPPASPVRRWAPRAAAWGWIRERLRTTPGRLELISVAVVVGAVAFALIGGAAERSRDRAAQAARTATEPLLVQAVSLYTSLSDAEATATTTFLTGGLEPAARRARYLGDLRGASAALSTLTRELGSAPAARAAVTTIADQLPVYTGLVESARANNRQGFPVGAAYLREASQLLSGQVLPAARDLYRAEATGLGGDFASGTGSAALVTFALVVAAGLSLLLLAQWHVWRTTRRVFNVPMLAATVALLAVAVWGLSGLVAEQNALADAQQRGSDPVEVLSTTRILLSRAQSDESLTLVNRGSDAASPVDFAAVMRELAPGDPLLAQVAHADLASAIASYGTQSAHIDRLAAAGDISGAINLAVASAANSSSPVNRLSADL